MRQHSPLLAIVVSIAFTAAQASGSTWASTALGKKKSQPVSQSGLMKVTPAPASSDDSPARGHVFQVNDVKGLLLTCIAPQLDTDPDTDIFNSCTLAPGRTLDDVMHTFIQGIHYEQKQQEKERAEWSKELEERQAQKPAQK
jgi:hypothetical protein